jgi:predicted transcriptional regulator
MAALLQDTLSQKQSSKRVLVRLPNDLYEELRRTAFERRVSQHSILLEAVRAKFAREKKGK